MLSHLLPLPPVIGRARDERRRLRIQARAVCRVSGLSLYAVRQIELGMMRDAAKVTTYVATVDAMAEAVRESLARLDALAAAGARPMTFGELTDALAGGEP